MLRGDLGHVRSRSRPPARICLALWEGETTPKQVISPFSSMSSLDGEHVGSSAHVCTGLLEQAVANGDHGARSTYVQSHLPKRELLARCRRAREMRGFAPPSTELRVHSCGGA